MAHPTRFERVAFAYDWHWQFWLLRAFYIYYIRIADYQSALQAIERGEAVAKLLSDPASTPALARLLRRFVENLMPIAVAERIPGTTSRDALVLTPADDWFGMRDLGGRFAWKLTGWQAERMAERIELLTLKDNRSGSEILEIGSEGEIPVKVSRGEFTDDFLVTRR
jgi:hypothetical protein